MKVQVYRRKGIYEKYIKRILDFVCALLGLIILSPLLVVLTIVGLFAMRGNPFFTQERPGKDEKIFKLIKFRTMSNAKDKDGNLLPDAERLTPYGRFLRSTSIDELPELINVVRQDMSLVGARPLLVEYLPLYNEHQRRRHEIRPGITGYAQVHGRNAISWEEKFDMDVWYVDHVSFITDLKILLDTVKVVFKRTGISSATSDTMEAFTGTAKHQDCN